MKDSKEIKSENKPIETGPRPWLVKLNKFVSEYNSFVSSNPNLLKTQIAEHFKMDISLIYKMFIIHRHLDDKRILYSVSFRQAHSRVKTLYSSYRNSKDVIPSGIFGEIDKDIKE